MKVSYKMWVLGHFAPWGVFGLWGIITFCLKNSEKKIDEYHKDLWTISSLYA